MFRDKELFSRTCRTFTCSSQVVPGAGQRQRSERPVVQLAIADQQQSLLPQQSCHRSQQHFAKIACNLSILSVRLLQPNSSLVFGFKLYSTCLAAYESAEPASERRDL